MRLIDADRLIDIVFSNMMPSYADMVKQYIDAQPTAYDVDKVIEEIKENSEDFIMFEDRMLRSLYEEDAIEIVKRGGQNEDINR